MEQDLADRLSTFVTLQPHMMTFITTYKCTAACVECCFGCHQKLEGSLDLEFIIAKIDEAVESFDTLEVVVFTGGECFLLGEDLFSAISHASSKGLKTRCVSNGYWGKKKSTAQKYAQKLVHAGISEMNFSTGVDHAEWVPVEAVVNCAAALAESGVSALITVEKDAEGTNILDSLRHHPLIKLHAECANPLVRVISNVWMPFHSDAAERRPQAITQNKDARCDQLFNNIVLTPHKRHSACCGLTLEHIPEMHLGDSGTVAIKQSYNSQFSDFLKLWIHADGPHAIIRTVLGEDADEVLNGVVHICHACAILHQSPVIVDAMTNNYSQYVPEVLARIVLRERLSIPVELLT